MCVWGGIVTWEKGTQVQPGCFLGQHSGPDMTHTYMCTCEHNCGTQTVCTTITELVPPTHPVCLSAGPGQSLPHRQDRIVC